MSVSTLNALLRIVQHLGRTGVIYGLGYVLINKALDIADRKLNGGDNALPAVVDSQ